jgi:TetR/AcrR family transcriptional regulator, transcriptional repressor of bet genes
MAARRSNKARKDPAALPGSARDRQRQRLIEACISALHVHGPSNATVERVTAIARMSPGIVRFYFKSKDAMMVASLQFLADEFEQQLLIPVSRLKADPVAALTSLVDLYLDPQIASPRKVSVWYSFWGEASSRAEYFDLCGQKDANFTALTRDLIDRMIRLAGAAQLDPDGISLGLIGVLEVLWQDIAFQDERSIDRPQVKRRAMSYLQSVFPGYFAGDRGSPATTAPRPAALPAVAPSWWLAGHLAQLPPAPAELEMAWGGRIVRLRRAATGVTAHWADSRAGSAPEVCERDGFLFLRGGGLALD